MSLWEVFDPGTAESLLLTRDEGYAAGVAKCWGADYDKARLFDHDITLDAEGDSADWFEAVSPLELPQ